MLTEQEENRIIAKAARDGYGISLDTVKRYFKQHEQARKAGDEHTMEKIEYHLTYLNFHYECGLLSSGQYDRLPEVIRNW